MDALFYQNYLIFLFFDCSSLIKIPDISKWEVDNVINIKSMFCYCSLLSFLPDITKWNLKDTTIDDIFKGCSSLITIPVITKWKKNNKIIIDEKKDISKKDISSIDSLSLQSNSDNVNQIISNVSSEMSSSEDKKDNLPSKDSNIVVNSFVEEDSSQKDDLSNYYDNFYK